MRKEIIHYSDGRLDGHLYDLVFNRLSYASGGIMILSLFPESPPGILEMHKQIFRGIMAAASAEIIFLCEHDVFYHPSHFTFAPLREDTFYYNVNVWHVRWPDGYAVAWDNCQQVSGLCASRELLLDYYRQRIAQIECEGFNRHYEPGLKQTVGGQKVENWRSEFPNLDIRHGGNLTLSKWSPDDFRNKRYAVGWRELPQAPGWNEIVGQ